MEIDIRTLIFVLGITHIIQIVVFIHQYSINKTFRGVGWWLFWSAAEIAGFTFMLLRGIPSVLEIAIIGQNALIVAGVIFLYIGIMRFFDKKENRALVISIFAVYISSILYFLFVNNDIQLRGVIISATLAIVSFLSARALLANKNRVASASANFISATFLAHGCYHVFRAVMLFVAPLSSSIFAPTLLNVTTYLDAIIAGNIWTFGFIIMINQRLNAEVTEAKEEIELIFDTSPDAVIITRLGDGLIVNVNEGFSALSGFARAEAIGKTVFDINIWADNNERQKFLNELSAKGFCDNFDVMFVRKDGVQLAGLLSAKIIKLKDMPHIISVTHDITGRKQAEVALKEAYAGLEDKVGERTRELRERLDELERFRAATVEREFRMEELRVENERLKAEKNK